MPDEPSYQAINDALDQIDTQPTCLITHGFMRYSSKDLTLELKLVDPATVKHFTRDQAMTLSEVIDEPVAIMMLAYHKGQMIGPIYSIVSQNGLASLKRQVLLQISNDQC